LLLDLLLKLEELLLLTLADSKILAGFLSLRECITIKKHIQLAWIRMADMKGVLCTQKQRLQFVELRYHHQPWLERWLRMQLGIGGMNAALDEQLWKWIVDT
jgi:hypothetical protein